MKRILDIQLKERDEQTHLRQFEDSTEARVIKQDVAAFESTEEQKRKKADKLIHEHN